MTTILEEQKAAPAESAQEHPTLTPQQSAAKGPDEQKLRDFAAPEPEKPATLEEILRPALGALSTTLATAFLVGGMFVGFTPRIYAALGGLVGVVMAVWGARARNRVNLIYGLSFFGVVLFALLLAAFAGSFDIITNLTDKVSEAAKNARLHKPPSSFDDGWKFILPLTVGLIGYAGAWIGAAGRKPAIGILFPQMPIIAFAAIAQPDEAQVPAGIVAFVAFVLGLAVIYRADRGEGEGVSTAYELKRAAKTAPLVILLTVVLVVLSRTGFLFPAPLYDPSQRAQLPKAVALSGVQDRVLYHCNGEFTGPWRVGVLDVYDSKAWRLPPYDEDSFVDMPPDGRLDGLFESQAVTRYRSDCTVKGLEGTVLPLPSRMFGVQLTAAPPLVVDHRSQTLRVKEGSVRNDLVYSALFDQLPTEDTLRSAGPVANADLLKNYTDTNNALAPPAAKTLIDLATTKTKNTWDKLNFIRREFLDNVTSEGAGLPVEVPPAKVEDMLAGSKIGTPYEIVAAQVLLARWAGVPARIGYGFDKGEKLESGIIEYRPKHGSNWLEVYFSEQGWFPITGLPKKAISRIDAEDKETLEANLLPGPDIGVNLFFPQRVNPKGYIVKQVQKILLMLLPFALAIALTMTFWPLVYKLRRRSQRRQWALGQGRSARIAVAYTDMRDLATDLGVGDPYATPLAYVRKVVPDEEHEELAWLVTRTLWGDMKDSVTDDEVFAAEELSRSIRRRMYEAQPFTIRGIALISRLSLRDPYAPELLSPPVAKVELRKVFAKLAVLNPLRVLARVRSGRAVSKESPDEAIEAA